MEDLKDFRYDHSVRQVTQPGTVQLTKNVNAWAVHNTGNTIVLVNDDPLMPGDSKSIGGNLGEIFMGRIYITFQIPSPAPSPIINMATVTQKYYTKEHSL